MTYSLSIPLNLGTNKAGLTLTAQLFNVTTDASIGSAISTGFIERTGGAYVWTGTIPSVPIGVAFLSGASELASTVISVGDVTVADPLANPIGSYAAGTIGYAISQIGAGRITVSSLQSGSQVRLATGYEQTLVFTDASNSWPDLTGASILMLTNVIYLGSAFSHAGTVVQATGTNKSVSVALLHTETVGMPVATNYKYDIQATLADGVTQLSLVKGGQLVTLAKPG